MGYSAAVVERARDPKHAGWLPRDAPDVGTGEATAADGQTAVKIQVRVDRSARRIDEAVFKAFGSDDVIASASLMTERLQGASVETVRDVNALAIVAELALPFERARVATLAVEAAKSAVDDWERKQ